MSLGLTRRLVKGSAITAAEHDANLDAMEGPIEAAYAPGNILGTVTQSAGVPTGALIERGSNSNGSYVRLADGTQICWITYDDTAGSWATAVGSFYRRDSSWTWTYPVAFSAAPVVLPTAHLGDDRLIGARPRGVPTTTSVSVQVWASSSAAAAVAKSIFAIATGRWF